jgi:hypothetical protein
MNKVNHLSNTDGYLSLNFWKETFKFHGTKVATFIKENAIFLMLGAYIGGGLSYKLRPKSLSVVVCGALAGFALFSLFIKIFFREYHNSLAPNNLHRVGPVWKVNKLVDQQSVEQALQRVVQDLKNITIKTDGYPTQTAYEICQEKMQDKILSKDLPFRLDDSVETIMRTLSNGLCFGQARTQMEHIWSHYNSDAKVLHQIPFENRIEVLYYQMMQYIEASLIPGKREVLAQAFSHSKEFEHYPRLIAQSKACAQEILIRLRCPQQIKQFAHTLPLASHSPALDYEQAFDQATKEFPDDLVKAGWIQVKSHENVTSHVIWFQCSDNKFRFQDTIDDLQGFFEFSNKKEFFKALQQQIGIHRVYQNGEIQLWIYGIEKSVK